MPSPMTSKKDLRCGSSSRDDAVEKRASTSYSSEKAISSSDASSKSRSSVGRESRSCGSGISATDRDASRVATAASPNDTSDADAASGGRPSGPRSRDAERLRPPNDEAGGGSSSCGGTMPGSSGPVFCLLRMILPDLLVRSFLGTHRLLLQRSAAAAATMADVHRRNESSFWQRSVRTRSAVCTANSTSQPPAADVGRLSRSMDEPWQSMPPEGSRPFSASLSFCEHVVGEARAHKSERERHGKHRVSESARGLNGEVEKS